MTGADRAVGRGQVDRTPTLCDHLIISIRGQINCLVNFFLKVRIQNNENMSNRNREIH